MRDVHSWSLNRTALLISWWVTVIRGCCCCWLERSINCSSEGSFLVGDTHSCSTPSSFFLLTLLQCFGQEKIILFLSARRNTSDAHADAILTITYVWLSDSFIANANDGSSFFVGGRSGWFVALNSWQRWSSGNRCRRQNVLVHRSHFTLIASRCLQEGTEHLFE